jgi:hypothetical protein
MSVNGQSAAGVTVPDTKLAREVTELIRDRTSDLVYNHSRRVFFWGSRQGRNRDLSYDPELLYVGTAAAGSGTESGLRLDQRRLAGASPGSCRLARTLYPGAFCGLGEPTRVIPAGLAPQARRPM